MRYNFPGKRHVSQAANDNGPARAAIKILAPMELGDVLRNRFDETIVFVEDGVVEFVVGGNIGTVTAGGAVRIPAGTVYTYRNAGTGPARLAVRAPVAGRTADDAA